MKQLETTCRCGRVVQAQLPEDLPDAQWWEDLFHGAVMCDTCAEQHQHEKTNGTPEQRRQRFFEKARGVGLPDGMIGWDESAGNNELLNEVWANREKSLWLAGEHRTGKTRSVVRTAAVMLWREELDETQLVYWRIPDLRKHLANMAGGDDSRREQEEYHRLGSVDVLILDDLDKGAMTDAGLEALWRIVDDRVARPAVRTWVTANTGSRDLVEQWIEGHEHRRETAVAIITRLREMCYQVHAKADVMSF